MIVDFKNEWPRVPGCEMTQAETQNAPLPIRFFNDGCTRFTTDASSPIAHQHEITTLLRGLVDREAEIDLRDLPCA